MADTSNDREVNADTEVLDLEDDPATPEGEDEDLDEEVIPPVDEDAEPADEDTEAEPAEVKAIPDSSPEDAEPETPDAPSQPAPVPGETPKEKALRLEITRLRGKLRENGIQQILVPGDGAPQPKAVTDRLTKLRETYSDEEIAAMEEAVDTIAESKGYVKQADNYQQTVNTIVEGFIKENPEYKPENDPEDVRWNRFQEILADGTYNIQGKTPEQLQRIFKKVHEDVVEELGAPTAEVTTRQATAQRQKIRSVSHAGGSKAPVVRKESSVDPSVRQMFKGFDDSDLTDD